MLQAIYDAVHAVALTTAGATSLMHEAKVADVTVLNLSEHLAMAETILKVGQEKTARLPQGRLSERLRID